MAMVPLTRSLQSLASAWHPRSELQVHVILLVIHGTCLCAEAEQPEDWDEEEDGEWEPPRITNPKCEAAPGCGAWERPTKINPAYKGTWYPPMIDNPEYKVRCLLLSD